MSKIFQATHVGKVRKNNEDSLIVIEPETFVAADGMGGQAAGEVASKILVETVKNFLPLVPEPWSEEILSKSIRKANCRRRVKIKTIAEWGQRRRFCTFIKTALITRISATADFIASEIKFLSR